MEILLNIILAATLLCPGNSVLSKDNGNDVFVPIVKYIEQGDADKLSAWFADNLEICVAGGTNDSSRNQARQILRSFFLQNTPQSFEITHTAGRPNMKYALGILKAGGEVYNVTIFVGCKHNNPKKNSSEEACNNSTFKIQQLKIERAQ